MKTYCISDIHGHYQNFLAFYETLEEDDLVYVLGDVIDVLPCWSGQSQTPDLR